MAHSTKGKAHDQNYIPIS